MIHLLFSVLFVEGFLVLIMMVKTPLRKVAIMGLDRVKRGKGPTVVKTISGTAFVVLMSSIYSMVKIQKRSDEFGSINPTDQVLMTRHLLEASLMGFSMFLALIIDRLHHYLRELRMQRKSIEALKAQQSRGFEDGKGGGSDLKALLEEIASTKAKIKKVESEDAAKTVKANEIATLKEKIKQLESEAVAKTADTNDIVSLKAIVKQLESKVEAKDKDAKTAEANTVALRKQLEGFHLEYERLSKENQNLRDQLKSIDRKVSLSDGKKNM
ncbi:B-cell receptor-associated protein 31-like protein [Cinnamomum micranthum f. kanehirae]|uniref:Endoplasmic reticulum transmembrane protein n=1 Tax=Cinnamomum micranthum f. kanehirae TaxID=337451 RepID=A0A3S3N7M1_9MAGN|nr:B-cell receptor-associated protein 31-like protein [Cinnamomum micranthum f. kanehirae]